MLKLSISFLFLLHKILYFCNSKEISIYTNRCVWAKVYFAAYIVCAVLIL